MQANPRPPHSPVFKVGDEVNITGPHPHRGESGRITAASTVTGFDWLVKGPWNSFFVSEHNMRPL